MSSALQLRVLRPICRSLAWSGLALLAALLLLVPSSSEAFIIRLPSHSEKCFIETVNKGDKVVGNMRVIAGGSLDIDLKITDPSLAVVLDMGRRSDESFAFYARESGAYTVCLSNSMSVVSGKVVSFNVYAGSRLAERDAASSEHLTPLSLSVQQLAQGVREVKDANSYMKTRERVHHQTVQSTNSRIVWWRLFQISALIALAGAKTYYLVHLFDKRRSA